MVQQHGVFGRPTASTSGIGIIMKGGLRMRGVAGKTKGAVLHSYSMYFSAAVARSLCVSCNTFNILPFSPLL